MAFSRQSRGKVTAKIFAEARRQVNGTKFNKKGGWSSALRLSARLRNSARRRNSRHSVIRLFLSRFRKIAGLDDGDPGRIDVLAHGGEDLLNGQRLDFFIHLDVPGHGAIVKEAD